MKKGYCVYTNRYIQGTYKWYVRRRGNKDQHEAFHGYAVCISLILGSTLQSYPWYIAVLVGMLIFSDFLNEKILNHFRGAGAKSKPRGRMEGR
jgi:hypothetical protein